MRINEKIKKISIITFIVLGIPLVLYLIIFITIIILYNNPSEFSLSFLANNKYAREFINNHYRYTEIDDYYATYVPQYIKNYEKQREVLKWFRNYPGSLMTRAIASIKLQQWSTAIEDLEQAIYEINSSNDEKYEKYIGNIYITLGDLYLRKNDEYMAGIQYTKALDYYEKLDIKFNKTEATCQNKSYKALLKLEEMEKKHLYFENNKYTHYDAQFYANYYDSIDNILEKIYGKYIERMEYAGCPQGCIDEAKKLKQQRQKYYYNEFNPEEKPITKDFDINLYNY